jgi:hypothetical protein
LFIFSGLGTLHTPTIIAGRSRLGIGSTIKILFCPYPAPVDIDPAGAPLEDVGGDCRLGEGLTGEDDRLVCWLEGCT